MGKTLLPATDGLRLLVMALTFKDRFYRLFLLVKMKMVAMKELDSAQVRSVLIFCEGGIGDLVMSSGVIESLSLQFNTTLTSHRNHILELLEVNFKNAEVVSPHSLCNRKFDLVITDFNACSNTVYNLIHKIRPRFWIGQQLDQGKPLDFFRNCWFTNIFSERLVVDRSAHFTEGYKTMANRLGVDSVLEPFFRNETKDMRDDISRSDKRTIAIQMDSSWNRAKNWPRYLELLRLLDHLDNYELIFVGSMQERKPIAGIVAGSGINNYRLVAGELSLLDTIRLIGSVDGYIGNDGGLGHVAGALGIPTIILFTTTPSNFVRPLGENVTCLNDPVPADVLSALVLTLNTPTEKPGIAA